MSQQTPTLRERGLPNPLEQMDPTYFIDDDEGLGIPNGRVITPAKGRPSQAFSFIAPRRDQYEYEGREITRHALHLVALTYANRRSQDIQMHFRVVCSLLVLVLLCWVVHKPAVCIVNNDPTVLAKCGCTRALQDLIEHKNLAVDYSPDENRESLLFVAAKNGNENTVKYLLNAGADESYRTYSLETPLHAATSSGCIGTVQLLLNFGANISVRDAAGLTPEDSSSTPEIVALLRKHAQEQEQEQEHHGRTAT